MDWSSKISFNITGVLLAKSEEVAGGRERSHHRHSISQYPV